MKRWKNDSAVAEVHLGIGRPGGTRCRKWCSRFCPSVGWCGACVADGSDRKTNDLPFTLTAGGRTPPWRTSSGDFFDDPGWDHFRLFLWPLDATSWIVLTPDADKYAERFAEYSRMRVPPFGAGTMPEVGSVEFNCGWTLIELSELVREGRNLALCARTSMRLTCDRDPTMMCDVNRRLFSVLPVTMGERVRRRIVRKLHVIELLL